MTALQDGLSLRRRHEEPFMRTAALYLRLFADFARSGLNYRSPDLCLHYEHAATHIAFACTRPPPSRTAALSLRAQHAGLGS
jgi:hypothetical protein